MLCNSCSVRLGRTDGNYVQAESCEACLGLSAKFDYYVSIAAEALSGYESSSFWLGAYIPKRIIDSDAKLSSGKTGIRKALEIYVGEALQNATGKVATPEMPDIRIILDTINERVSLDVSSVFFYGRYIKKARGIPQSKWLCKKCRGRGCSNCGFTGRMYPTSVEEEIARPLIEMCSGAGSKLHALGREDIDVRMLGNGRPFAIEIISPKRRFIDLAAASRDIASSGNVEAIGLRPSSDAEALKVDTAVALKRYDALIASDSDVDADSLNRISDMSQIELEQRIPERVSRRRSDLVRIRTVSSIRFYDIKEGKFRMELQAEHGTYIKEFVNGDNGRTRPSLSQLLGISCSVLELDVTGVEFESLPD